MTRLHTTMKTSRVSTYLGQLNDKSPEFGICVEDGNWCSQISTDKEKRVDEIVTSFKRRWEVFEGQIWYDRLRHCENVKEHYDTVTFKVNPQARDEEYKFAFYVDNKRNERYYGLLSVYSMQDKSMAFPSYAVHPKRLQLLKRFSDEDKAFSLTKHTSRLSPGDEQKLAKDIFEGNYTKDICSFIAVVAQGKLREGVRSQIDSDHYEYDEVISYRNFAMDGEDETDGIDGMNSKHYANLMRGSSTDQHFNSIKLDSTMTPIDIYNINIVIG